MSRPCAASRQARSTWRTRSASTRSVRLERTEAIDALLLPVAAGLDGLPEVTVTPEAAARLALGNPAPVLTSGGAEYGDLVWAARDGLPVALGDYMGGTLHPSRVFVYADAPTRYAANR